MLKTVILQGAVIPEGLGHDENPAIAAVIVSVSDLKDVAKENGYQLTDMQARDILESRGEDITEALLNECSIQLWLTLGDDIEQVGSARYAATEEEEEEEEMVGMAE